MYIQPLRRIATPADAAAALVGRKIVSVDLRPFTEDERTYTDPVLTLDNGSTIVFQVHTLDAGDAVTLLVRESAPQHARSRLATFRAHLRGLDKFATVVFQADDGSYTVRTNLHWSDGRRFGKPVGKNEALSAFAPGLPGILDVRHVGIEGSRHNARHVWCVLVDSST